MTVRPLRKADKHFSNLTATNNWQNTTHKKYLFGLICPYPASLNYLLDFIKTCNYSFTSTNMLPKTNSIKLECSNPKSIILMGHVCWQHFALHFDFTLFMLNGQVAVFPSCFHFSVPVKLGISKRGNHFMKPGTANSPESSYASLHHISKKNNNSTGLTEPHKKAIQGFPQQKPVRDMHSFLGLVAAIAMAMDQTVTLTQVLRDDG